MVSSNTIYIADSYNQRVQEWPIPGTNSTTVAGPAAGGATFAVTGFNYPGDVAIDSRGTLYVADTNNHRVMRWSNNSASGTLFAGTGKRSSLGRIGRVMSCIEALLSS